VIEKTLLGDELLALVIRREFRSSGIEFFTPDTFSQQIGYMNRPDNYVIAPHTHNSVTRTIEWTQEVLLIKSGKVRVDIYASDRTYIESYVLDAGDVILLAHGGHGLFILEQAEIIEVKQGPYAGDADKTRFDPIDESHIRIKG
jgi:hypothetical protein